MAAPRAIAAKAQTVAAARAGALVFEVSDGRWEGRAAAGEGELARVRGTRAVLGFVQSVAAALPAVGRSLWAAGR